MVSLVDPTSPPTAVQWIIGLAWLRLIMFALLIAIPTLVLTFRDSTRTYCRVS